VKTLAIIPARGGSKRVPGKNLAMVGGRSLVDRAIDAALGAGCEAVVSSDDEQILTHAHDPYHAESGFEYAEHRRKPEHATDAAQIEPVIDDVLDWRRRMGATWEPDAIVLLQPTSPFRTAAHVTDALRILRETGCDSVVSVTRLHSLHDGFNGALFEHDEYDPAFKTVREDGTRYMIRRAGQRVSSSELGGLVYENGAVYAFTIEHWKRTRNRMGGDMRALVMDAHDATEIDTPKHLEEARVIAAGRAAMGLR
jgi:CMP-N-acetylneuraminic acid synthetase